MQRSLVLAPLVLTLAACGPTYRTNYTLNEPATPEGRLCSLNVIRMSDTCVANCRQMARNCYNPGGFGTSIGFGTRGYGSYETVMGGSTILDDRDCSPVQCEESCLAAARSSHVSCGGTVTQQTVCTANCPPAAATTLPSR